MACILYFRSKYGSCRIWVKNGAGMGTSIKSGVTRPKKGDFSSATAIELSQWRGAGRRGLCGCLLLLVVVRGASADLLIVLLEGGKVLTGLGELTLLHAL